jgi:hypothetical protein
MAEWWNGLSALNQVFYVAAVFFSTIFLWQLFSAFTGLGDHGIAGADHADAGGQTEVGPGDLAGGDWSHGDIGHGDWSHGDAIHPETAPGEAMSAESVDHDLLHDASGLATFRLLSVRSILAFGTLFSWGGALYLERDLGQGAAIVFAALWGLAGLLVVAAFFWILPRMAESGTSNLDTAIGQVGEVYMNISEDGVGQVKVIVSGALQFVRARSEDGRFVRAGTPVRIVRRIDSNSLLVRPIEQ